MADEQNQQQEQQQQQVVAKPEWADDRFWDKEKNELRVEDIHKSWKHANDKISGKKQAPDAYAIELGDDIPKEYIEDITDDDALVVSMKEFAKENDLSQAAFNKLMANIVGRDVGDFKALEDARKAELAQLGEHGPRRIKELSLWLDATLDAEEAAGLKAMMSSAKAVMALEKIKDASKPPSLKTPEGIPPDEMAAHAELKKKYLAKDEFGNRLMQNPQYAAQWREEAARANYKAA